MVTVKAMAPFELAEIFTAWAQRWNAHANFNVADSTIADLGPPVPGWHDEDPETYGRRIAAGIITLLKEV